MIDGTGIDFVVCTEVCEVNVIKEGKDNGILIICCNLFSFLSMRRNGAVATSSNTLCFLYSVPYSSHVRLEGVGEQYETRKSLTSSGEWDVSFAHGIMPAVSTVSTLPRHQALCTVGRSLRQANQADIRGCGVIAMLEIWYGLI